MENLLTNDIAPSSTVDSVIATGLGITSCAVMGALGYLVVQGGLAFRDERKERKERKEREARPKPRRSSHDDIDAMEAELDFMAEDRRQTQRNELQTVRTEIKDMRDSLALLIDALRKQNERAVAEARRTATV